MYEQGSFPIKPVTPIEKRIFSPPHTTLHPQTSHSWSEFHFNKTWLKWGQKKRKRKKKRGKKKNLWWYGRKGKEITKLIIKIIRKLSLFLPYLLHYCLKVWPFIISCLNHCKSIESLRQAFYIHLDLVAEMFHKHKLDGYFAAQNRSSLLNFLSKHIGPSQ